MKTIIVPVSGGKDSQVCARLAIQRFKREQLRFVHQRTGYDHPDTYAHLVYMEKRYKIKIEYTQSEKYKDVFDLIEKVGYFPGQVARGCTSRLKQHPFAKWLRDNKFTEPDSCLIYMGMRADESSKRGSKYGHLDDEDEFYLPDISSEYGLEFRHVAVTLPIVTWTTEKVFNFLRGCGDKINPLYAKGHHRVGCYPCLLARNAEWEAAARDPIGREHIKRLLDIEQKFVDEKNPRKLIRIHPTRDVRALYGKNTPCAPNDDKECGWCSI